MVVVVVEETGVLGENHRPVVSPSTVAAIVHKITYIGCAYI